MYVWKYDYIFIAVCGMLGSSGSVHGPNKGRARARWLQVVRHHG